MKKILIVFLLCVIFILMIFIKRNPSFYNSNYWDDIGLQGTHLYENIIAQKGYPREIQCVDNESIVTYDDMRFIWYNTNLKGIFQRVEIVDNTLLLGRKKLSVGSDKNEVIMAYKSIFIKPIKDLPKNCIGYVDYGSYVIYYFDENDKVELITVSAAI